MSGIVIPELKYSIYSPIVLLSIIIGIIMASLLMKKAGVTAKSIFYTDMLVFVFIIVCSFMMSIALTGDIRRISFVAAGGAAGLILGATLSIFIISEKVIDTAIAWVLATPLMYGLSKIACFLTGCCHGIRYKGAFNVIYVTKGHDSYFPIQLLESIVFVIIFIIGLILYLKLEDKRLLVARLVVILSAIAKIGLEYLRFNHAERGVSGYQVAIFTIACVAYILVVFIDKKFRKTVKN